MPLTVVRASSGMVVGDPPTSASGTTVAQPTTDSTGSFSVQLEPGRYYVFGAGIYGLTAPAPLFFDVSAGSTASVTILYGTAVR